MFAAHAHAQSPSSGIANSGLSSNPPSTNDFVNRALSTFGNRPACAQFNGPTECAGMSGVFSFGAADGARVVHRRTPLCIDECDSPLAWPPGRSTAPKPGGGTPLGVPGLTVKARTKQPCCGGRAPSPAGGTFYPVAMTQLCGSVRKCRHGDCRELVEATNCRIGTFTVN
jgi:hypothetical protein